MKMWFELPITNPTWFLIIHSMRMDRDLLIMSCNDKNKIIELMTKCVNEDKTLYRFTIQFHHEHVLSRVNEDIIADFADVNSAFEMVMDKIKWDDDICKDKHVNRDTFLTKFDSLLQARDNKNK
jgi:hypothetical protein